MNRPLWLFVGCILPGLVLASPDKEVKAQFQARYDEYVRAYAARDVAAVEKLLAPDYSSGDYLHLTNKTQELEALKYSDGKFKTLSRKVLSVVVNGKKASVLEDSVTKGKMREPKRTVYHDFEIRMRCLDTWVKSPSGWQLKHMRTVKTSTLEDGRPFKPKQKPVGH